MLACARGAVDLVKFLLSKGADTRQQDKQGRNALFYAVQSGNITILEILIKSDRHCYLKDNDGCGAFLFACKREHFEVIEFFIENYQQLGLVISSNKNKSLLSEKDAKGRNGIHFAAELGNKPLYLMLTGYGMPVCCDNEGRCPLMLACLSAGIDFVRFLVSEQGMSHQQRQDDKGRNAVFYAITAGNVEMIEYLADNGFSLDITTSGLTPLMQASGKGSYFFLCLCFALLKCPIFLSTYRPCGSYKVSDRQQN